MWVDDAVSRTVEAIAQDCSQADVGPITLRKETGLGSTVEPCSVKLLVAFDMLVAKQEIEEWPREVG